MFNKNSVQDRFRKCIQNFEHDISGINPRANSNLLNSIKCEAYGDQAPITNFSNISVVDSKTILIQVWDTSLTQDIYKAIQNAGLGVGLAIEGNTIKVSIPPISEDRRKEMVKRVEKSAETAKIAIRKVRQDEMDNIKKSEKDKKTSEDQAKRDSTELQKITDEAIKKIDELCKKKSEDVLKI